MEVGTITHLQGDAKPDGDIYSNPIDGQPGMFWIAWDNPELAACWMADRLLKPFPVRGDRVRYQAEVQPEHDKLHGLVGTVTHLDGDEGYSTNGEAKVWVEWDKNDKYEWGYWCPVDLLRKA